MIVAGLTGSVASGKSTVSRMFEALGAYVIDWDVVAREVVQPYQTAWNGIVDYFGSGILNQDMTLNREKLGKIVFADPEKLEVLNRITHPAVIEADEERVEEIGRNDPDAIVLKDIPLLFEIGYQANVDKTIVVNVGEENQLRRMIDRGFDAAEAQKRIAAQMPLSEKIELADFVIQNDGSLVETEKQVKDIFDALCRLKR